MSEEKQNGAYKKFLMVLLGTALLIVGVTLILAWREEVVALFKGFLGIVAAIGGLLVLYSIKK